MQIMRELIDKLNEWTEAYDEGNPVVSDQEWDKAYFELKRLEDKTHIIYPDSPTFKISYKVKTQLNKVKHNHKMLSLDKTKDWMEFISYFSKLDASKDICQMLKLDGLTCSLRYIDGKLVSAETRGDGEIGEDILHNAQVISSIPQTISYKDELILDGEVICTTENFKEFSDEYKNPRNFAAGSIRLLDAEECKKRKLDFVVWNIEKGYEESNSFCRKLITIQDLGFLVVPWVISFDWDSKEYLLNIANELGYPIDGLVARFDDVAYGRSLGATSHHSRAAYAFKFFDETYDTLLLDIEWTMGRTGVLTPVAIFDTLDIDGSAVSRASLHNLNVMEELLGTPYLKQPLKIYKANMIIPQVESAVKRDFVDIGDEFYPPEVCPYCGADLSIDINIDSGVKNVICNNPACEAKLINKLNHFCGKKGLKIRGLSNATLEKLINWGWINTCYDIFMLKDYRSDWIKKSGFGVKSVDNILTAIEKSKKVTLDKFIASLGIPLIGSSVSKELVKHISSYEEFREKVDTHFNFDQYEGFADSKTMAIWKYDYSIADKIYKDFISIEEPENNSLEVHSNSLDGVTIVVTGKLTLHKNRAELQSKIENAGGKVVGSISKNVKYLINNDVTSTSSKNVSAKKLGISIISEEEFIKKFF